MVAIGNPIRGVLHDNAWQRPAGNTDMRVTQTAAQHVAKGGPPALDIGDGNPDLDDILSPHVGTVAQALTVGSANLSVDFDSEGKKWRIVLAHNTLPHPVAVNQPVTEGQVVGRMGNTSLPTMPVPIHLHIQLGYLEGTTWKWVDPWPYLRQNGATEEVSDMLQGTNPRPVENRKVLTSTGSDGLRFRSSPFVTVDNVIDSLPNGTELHPDFIVDGTKVGPSADPRWYGSWAKTAKGQEFGYVSVVFCSAPVPIDQVGHTDADLKKAAHDAAVVVQTAGATALSNAAAKYPA